MAKKRPLIHIALWAAFFFAIAPHFAGAAERAVLRIRPPDTKAVAGEPFTVGIVLDAPNPVNAYSLDFGYSDDKLKITRISTANSIITIWRNQPIVTDGNVHIGGGSLAPFEGTDGKVAEITFEPIEAGGASFAFRSATLYAADGKGTPITPLAEKADFSIGASSTAAAFTAEIANDTTFPSITNISITQDPYEPDNKIFSFNANDSGSGIDAVFVRTKTGLFWSDWERAVNPVGLPRNAWAAEVRAVDNAGNSASATAYDPAVIVRDISSLILLCAAFVILGFILKNKRIRRML